MTNSLNAETGLNGATNSLQQLAAQYIAKKAEAARVTAELKQAIADLEHARENGELDQTWNKRSKAYLMPGGLTIRQTSRTTYSAKSYSDTLQKLMEKEREDGTAKPTISSSYSYKVVED